MRKFLQGRKTYIVAILMAMVALVDLVTGSISLVDFVQSDHIRILLDSIGLATLRAGVGSLKGGGV